MKKYVICLSMLMFVGSVAMSESLVLSGVVSDRGYFLNSGHSGTQLSLIEGTDLKIYLAPMKASRSPQSVQNTNAKQPSSKNWVLVAKNQTITAPSYIKVEAP